MRTEQDWEEFESIGRSLERHDYRFAKTMPKNPHFYTMRHDWRNEEFIKAVSYIREHGRLQMHWNKPYTVLDVNDFFYWTMGAPIGETILINRKLRDGHEYDCAAEGYDQLFSDPASLEENKAVIDLIGDLSRSRVLDVGCGTGLLLDYVNPAQYTGIDPSAKMLERLVAKHAWAEGRIKHTDLLSFVGQRYDFILGLFGSASYLTPDELGRIPALLNDGGKYFLMFFKEGYYPVTHTAFGLHVEFGTYDGIPAAASITEYHNFVIVKGSRNGR